MPFIAIRDIQLFYELHGNGPRLLSISGTGADLRRSPNVFESPLAKHFEILAYDQRGLGQSDRPDAACTMLDYAEDARCLLDALHWDRCLVMGTSFGGMVGQELALRYPQRIEKLVLACTSSGGAGAASYPLHELPAMSIEERARWGIAQYDTRHDAKWQAANPQEFQLLFDQMVAGFKVGADEPGRAMGARRQLEARKDHDTFDRLPQLRMPVFICGGKYDGIAPPSNQSALRKQIPSARLELFEGGHLFLRQDPEAYARVIAFLLAN